MQKDFHFLPHLQQNNIVHLLLYWVLEDLMSPSDSPIGGKTTEHKPL